MGHAFVAIWHHQGPVLIYKTYIHIYIYIYIYTASYHYIEIPMKKIRTFDDRIFLIMGICS